MAKSLLLMSLLVSCIIKPLDALALSCEETFTVYWLAAAAKDICPKTYETEVEIASKKAMQEFRSMGCATKGEFTAHSERYRKVFEKMPVREVANRYCAQFIANLVLYSRDNSGNFKLDLKVDNVSNATPKKDERFLVCRGRRTTNFGLPPQSESCDVSISQPTTETVIMKYRPSNSTGSCSLGYINGVNPQNPNISKEGSWTVVKFSSREQIFSYGKGLAFDKSSFQKDGSTIILKRRNYQTHNTVEFYVTLWYDQNAKSIALQHITALSNGEGAKNEFDASCQAN